MTPTFWSGRRVLVTGHTGFKGAWLAFWLHRLQAEVTGFALAPATDPSLFDLLGLEDRCASRIGDVGDPVAISHAISESRPEIVIHMAAQALVRESYGDPIGTFRSNVMGVVNLLDAVRRTPGVKAVVVVTSDKCYENVEQIWGYREPDPLGGHDPYSASKGAAEIATRSMQRSYFRPHVATGHPARIATVRAGNVIGGGDWSPDRLVPDIIRGCLGPAGQVRLRNPGAVRPWQHVVDALGAYLALAERLVTSPDGFDEAWNIGPALDDIHDVGHVAWALVRRLGRGTIIDESGSAKLHEARTLMLDCSKARIRMGWKPRFTFEACVAMTADWYAAWQGGADVTEITAAQLRAYEIAAGQDAYTRKDAPR